MLKYILVTWVAGFIASNLSEELVNQWWNVIWIDNFMTWHKKNIQELLQKSNFKFIWQDVRDYKWLEKIIKENDIQYISHQAARWSVHKLVEDPVLLNDINVNWTLNIKY